MTATPILRLRPVTGSEDPDRFASQLADGFSGDEAPARLLLEQTRAFFAANPRPAPWGGYLACEGDRPVGSCAFKFPPDAQGAVEIAYTTFPAFERRGYAGAMITALVETAFGAGAAAIIAYTLAEENPSTRALRRNGFALDGEVVDPEDGRVWRWRRDRDH